MQKLCLQEVDSTNTWVAANTSELKPPVLVYALSQTSGRGQRGNIWESSPGENITASVFFKLNDFDALSQFQISEAIALSVVEFLASYEIKAKVKWPNDIYVGDKKICGILVEHSVLGKKLSHTIGGIGININQSKFYGDAPNPVSMHMLTGRKYNIEEAIDRLSAIISRFIQLLEEGENFHGLYIKKLWRGDGKFHQFYDKNKGEMINARISDVMPQGTLRLVTDAGEKRDFQFKEVEYIL